MKNLKSTIKKLGLLSAGVGMLTVLGASSVFASDVTRSFSTITPTAGTPLSVSLTVNVTPPDNIAPNDFYIIDEVLPTGWVVSVPGTGDITQAGHIKWALLNGAVNTVNQYTVTVPGTATGLNAFSGEFAFGSNLTLSSVLGATSVDVQAPAAPPVVTLTSAAISPATASVIAGATQALSASPVDQNGTAFVGAVTTWSSDNTSVATVNPTTGVVTGVAAGTATITATTVNGATTVTSTSAITVTGVVAPPVVTLTSAAISPATASVIAGATQALSVSPVDQNGTAFVGAVTTWSSSNTAIATVNPTTGVVTGVAAGTATITGTTVSGATTVTSTSAITVTAVAPTVILTAVDVSPAAVSMATGITQVLSSLPVDQNGTAFVGAVTTWSSDNTAVATVNPTTGVVTGVAAGTARITATTVSGGVTVNDKSTVTVTTPAAPAVVDLTTVNVSPAAVSMVAGATQVLSASPVDQNGAAFVGAVTTWSSDNTAVATVNPTTGVVTGVAAGTATITATTVNGGITVNDKSIVTVTAPVAPPVVTLTSAAISPATASVIAGATQALSVSPVDQNGTAFVGAVTTWSSSNTAIATVNPTTGVVTGVAAGTATITGTTVSGATTVTSTSAITVQPVTTNIQNEGQNTTTFVSSGGGFIFLPDDSGNRHEGVDELNHELNHEANHNLLSDDNNNNHQNRGSDNSGNSNKGMVLGKSITKFIKNLGSGSSGDDVKALQNILMMEGLFTVEANGHFGPITRSALMKWQAENNLPATGIFGEMTREKFNEIIISQVSNEGESIDNSNQGENIENILNKNVTNFSQNLSIGSQGDDVKALQNMLMMEGLFTVEANGHFGPITRSALMKWQAENNLPATGIFGEMTRGKLNQKSLTIN